jgi:hypothetical protein
MGEPIRGEINTKVRNGLIEEANADEAYVRVLPDALKLDGSMLNPITLDVMSVVIATMGVAKKIAPLRGGPGGRTTGFARSRDLVARHSRGGG